MSEVNQCSKLNENYRKHLNQPKFYVKYKGVMLPKYFSKFGDKIEKMDIKTSDIWVCSFPRSGNRNHNY